MTLHLSLIRCWIQTYSALIGRSGGNQWRFTSRPRAEETHTCANYLSTPLAALSGSLDMHARTPGFVVALWGNSGCSWNSVSRCIRTVTADIRQRHTWALGSSITSDQSPFALCFQRGDRNILSVNICVTLALSGLSFGRELLFETSKEDLFYKKHLSVLSFPEEVDRRFEVLSMGCWSTSTAGKSSDGLSMRERSCNVT